MFDRFFQVNAVDTPAAPVMTPSSQRQIAARRKRRANRPLPPPLSSKRRSQSEPTHRGRPFAVFFGGQIGREPCAAPPPLTEMPACRPAPQRSRKRSDDSLGPGPGFSPRTRRETPRRRQRPLPARFPGRLFDRWALHPGDRESIEGEERGGLLRPPQQTRWRWQSRSISRATKR